MFIIYRNSFSGLGKRHHVQNGAPCLDFNVLKFVIIFEFMYLSEAWWGNKAYILDSQAVRTSSTSRNRSSANCSPTQQLLPPSTPGGSLSTKQDGWEAWVGLQKYVRIYVLLQVSLSIVERKPRGLQASGPAILMWWIQIQNTVFLIPEYILLNIIYEKRYCCPVKCIQWGFPGGSVVKNIPSKQEKQVQSLGLGRPLRKEMATHSSIHAWEIPWKEEQGRLQSWSHKRVRHNLATKQQQQSTYNL